MSLLIFTGLGIARKRLEATPASIATSVTTPSEQPTTLMASASSNRSAAFMISGE